MKYRSFYSEMNRAFLPFAEFNFLRLGKYIQKVAFDFFNCAFIRKPDAAFKVQHKAAVIHIYRADGSDAVVRKKNL